MDKCQCFLGQLGVAKPPRSPVHAARTEVGAGRERDQHVPVVDWLEEISHITAVMLAHRIAWLKEIAAPRIPASGRELIANPATVLTRNKNSGLHKNPTCRTIILVVKMESFAARRNRFTRFPILGFGFLKSVWHMENLRYRGKASRHEVRESGAHLDGHMRSAGGVTGWDIRCPMGVPCHLVLNPK
jgi:hypothetical protein